MNQRASWMRLRPRLPSKRWGSPFDSDLEHPRAQRRSHNPMPRLRSLPSGAFAALALTTVSLTAVSLTPGCSFHARDADSYRKVTRALLETRDADIKGCYDAALVKNPKLGGTVVVSFTVEKETGVISHAKMDTQNSTAPADLGECVVRAIDGLTLDPPDAREGNATFRWEFQTKT